MTGVKAEEYIGGKLKMKTWGVEGLNTKELQGSPIFALLGGSKYFKGIP